MMWDTKLLCAQEKRQTNFNSQFLESPFQLIDRRFAPPVESEWLRKKRIICARPTVLQRHEDWDMPWKRLKHQRPIFHISYPERIAVWSIPFTAVICPSANSSSWSLSSLPPTEVSGSIAGPCCLPSYASASTFTWSKFRSAQVVFVVTRYTNTLSKNSELLYVFVHLLLLSLFFVLLPWPVLLKTWFEAFVGVSASPQAWSRVKSKWDTEATKAFSILCVDKESSKKNE